MLGGLRLARMSPLIGSYGARIGPILAIATSRLTAPSPTQRDAGQCRRRRATRMPSAAKSGGADSSGDAWLAIVLSANPGIDEGIRDVGQEVDHDEEERENQRCALDGRVVTGVDGVDKEVTYTRQGKNCLDHDRAAEEETEIDANDGDRGQESVAHRVFGQDEPAGEPFGAGGPDIILAQNLQHPDAQGAEQDWKDRDGNDDRRQDEVVEVLGEG